MAVIQSMLKVLSKKFEHPLTADKPTLAIVKPSAPVESDNSRGKPAPVLVKTTTQNFEPPVTGDNTTQKFEPPVTVPYTENATAIPRLNKSLPPPVKSSTESESRRHPEGVTADGLYTSGGLVFYPATQSEIDVWHVGCDPAITLRPILEAAGAFTHEQYARMYRRFAVGFDYVRIAVTFAVTKDYVCIVQFDSEGDPLPTQAKKVIRYLLQVLDDEDVKK